jgi:mono/diheme cytochrome c family protein
MTSLKHLALVFLAAAAVAAPDADSMKRGAAAYAKGTCIACHQANGAGLPGVFPPLAGSEWVSKDASIAVRNILHGMQGPIVVKGLNYNGAMPALGAVLSDKEIADVVTFVSNSWGNAGPNVTEDEVKAIKKKYAGRNKPWTAAEYEKEAPAKK